MKINPQFLVEAQSRIDSSARPTAAQTLDVKSQKPDAFFKVPLSKGTRFAGVRFHGIRFGEGSMADLQKRGVLVAGANGTMGKDILQNAQQSLFNGVAMDRDLHLAKTAVDDIAVRLLKAKDGKHIKPHQYEAILKKTALQVIDGPMVDKAGQPGGYQPGQIPNVGLVIEAIFENLPAKQALFENLEKLLPEDTVLATNTSSLAVDDIAAKTKHPERVVGLHYFLPAVSNRLIEVIPGSKTSPEVVDKMMKYSRAIGKLPIQLKKDSPGAVANRMLVGVALEGMRLYEDGYGSPEAIDEVAKKVFWPQFADLKQAQGELMPPFAMFKRYGSMGVDIVQNVGKLGKLYQPTDKLLEEHNRVLALRKGPLAEAKKELEEAENRYKEKLQALIEEEGRTPLSEQSQLSETFGLTAVREEVMTIRGKVKALEAQAQYFPNGLPPAGQNRPESDAEKRAMIEKRLLGAYYGIALNILDEDICNPEDIVNAGRMGFKWNIKPHSPEQIQSFLDIMKTRYGDDFRMPETKAIQPSFVKTGFDPKTGALSITLDKIQWNVMSLNYHTLGTETLKAIKSAVEEGNNNPNVKSIVIQSNGGKVFSGGADLNEIQGQEFESLKTYLQLGRDVMDAIANSPKLTVAKVQGDAYGGGVELALACDKIVASDTATFTLPEVNLGIFPAWGGTERLPEKVGKPLSKALILGGKSRLGLLQHLWKPAQSLINDGLKWDLDSPGYRLDIKTAQQVGLVDVVTTRQSLDDTLEALLQDETFLDKPDPKRGLKTFQTPEDYPPSVAEAFRLATVEDETKASLGQYNEKGWAIANKLIEAAGTEAAGQYTEKEMKGMLKDAGKRNEKLMELVDASIAFQNGDQSGSYLKMLKAFATDKRFIPGLAALVLPSKK